MVNSISNATHQTLIKNGLIHLTNVNVRMSAVFNGSLTATGSNLNNLTMNGSSNFTGCHISNASINGLITATDTVFQDSLAIASNMITLSGCRTSNIVINKTPNGEVQELHLKNATQVEGTIRFVGNNGKVIKDDSSVVTGAIIGEKAD